MSTDLFETPAADADAAVFADRLLAATLGGMDLVAIHLGRSLGWYQALVDDGPLTPSTWQPAPAPRSATRVSGWSSRPWAAGCSWRTTRPRRDPASVPRRTRGRRRPHRPRQPAARRTRGRVRHRGVPSDRRLRRRRTAPAAASAGHSSGPDARTAQAALNRPLFLDELAQEIVPTIPELHARLAGAARVADIGSGEGWSSIGLAAAFPAATFEGFDVDEPSVAAARRHAADARARRTASRSRPSTPPGCARAGPARSTS